MDIESVEFHGHRAVRLSNGIVELKVLTGLGPRVIAFGFYNDENEFKVYPEQLAAAGRKWANFGGGRLWIAPETSRTYFPDHAPVEMRRNGDMVSFLAPPETWPDGVRLQKEIRLRLAEAGVEVNYRIANLGRRALRLAPWAISVMAPGGTAILPLPPRAPWGAKNFLPNGSLIIWPYTDLSDRRWVRGQQYLSLRQLTRPRTNYPWQKIGIHHAGAWLAYYRRGHLFIKQAGPAQPAAEYPDFGCHYEVYTNPQMLELESLGPLGNLAPGKAVTHRERWGLWRDVPAGAGDGWIEREIANRAKAMRAGRRKPHG